MPAAATFTGLACGLLLAAAGLALWDGLRHVPGLSHAVRGTGWLASGCLLIGTALAWPGDPVFSTPTLRLTLMAAVAAPEIRPRRRSWSGVMRILPALALAGATLLWPPAPTTTATSAPPFALAGVAIAVCGGLSARAIGETLSGIASPTPRTEGPARSDAKGPATAAYVLLTLLVGGTALVNLGQRGTMWAGTAGEGGLAGAWLAWSAACTGLRPHRRLRAALTTAAALSLVLLAVSG